MATGEQDKQAPHAKSAESLPGSLAVIDALHRQRSVFLTARSAGQINWLTRDLVDYGRAAAAEHDGDLDAVLRFVSGRAASRINDKPKGRRISFGDEVREFSEGESSHKLFVIKNVSCRPQSGGGIRGAFRALSEIINDPARPMVLGVSLDRWQVTQSHQDLEPGSVGHILGQFSLGMALDETGEFPTYYHNPFVVPASNEHSASPETARADTGAFVVPTGRGRLGLSQA